MMQVPFFIFRKNISNHVTVLKIHKNSPSCNASCNVPFCKIDFTTESSDKNSSSKEAEAMTENPRLKGAGTFVVKILDRQNATWQGQVTWAEKKQTLYFRSALELLKLIDSTIDTGSGWEQPEEGGLA